MLDSMTLTNIILAELVIVLALGCGILTFFLVRERRLQRRLLKAYRRMSRTIRSDRDNSAGPGQREPGDEATRDPVSEYLSEAREQAKQRYRNITQSTVPRLAPDQPFNAKVAGLRYLYCEAEERAHRKAQASGDVWVLLERQLYDIARWIVDQEDRKPSRQRNNQVKLLQQRVQKLKGYEKQCRDLQRKLDLGAIKREELERLRDEHTATIEKLQRINDALSLGAETSDQSAESLRRELADIIAEPPSGERATERRMTNIEHFSQDNQRLSRELSEGLRSYSSEFPSQQSAQLETTIKRLEAELYRSERHIAELQQQHRVGPESAAGPTTAGTLVENPDQKGEESREATMETIEDTLKVIHTQMADSSSRLSEASNSPYSGSGTAYSLAEIQQLRGNNQRQRNLIVDLEGELNNLRQAIPETEDEDLRAMQVREMERLERLVKECEHCILALESEVELLYTQLQERHARQESEATAEPESTETLTQLRQELDALSERLEDNQNDTLIKQFVLDSLGTQSLEEVARALFSTLKRAQLVAGFAIRSQLGQAEYFPAKHFTPNERSTVRRTTMSGNIAYLNEGILFAGKHIHLMLKMPPDDEAELEHIEKLLHTLLELCGSRIDNLELEQLGSKLNRDLGEWSMITHNTLVNMEIGYAYQVEESLRLLDNLVEQLQRASRVAGLSEATQTVIENALSECQSRIKHLLTDDRSVEGNCNQLLDHLEHLPKAPL